jgi:hypothetical protein
VIELERMSIEVTNKCQKGCWFCYSTSTPAGETLWTEDELVAFVGDCAKNGVKAVSFGGGEPLEFAPIFSVLARTRGSIFRSITTNGLLLQGEKLERLIAAAPEKVHVSIHFPERAAEVERVIAQVQELARLGVKSGVNLLVGRASLAAATNAAVKLRASGISNERIVYLPQRISDTPTPEEVAAVAGHAPFQSMTCLSECKKSPRFASIGWDRSVAWCSYTRTRALLGESTHAGLTRALAGLGLEFCGGKPLPLRGQDELDQLRPELPGAVGRQGGERLLHRASGVHPR